MGIIKEIKSILTSINRHPLASKHKVRAYYRFFKWQLITRLTPGAKKIIFTDNSFLLVRKGMAGATGNIYMGLHEFEDMGFLLHFLRSDDLFLDIGANIGSYTILASSEIGSRTFSFEPVPETFSALKNNVSINNSQSKVSLFNVGVGARNGKLFFTSKNDSINHVVIDPAKYLPDQIIEVPIISIDEILSDKNSIPVLVKIDVEGFETEVLNGMDDLLSNHGLKAIIIELNGCSVQFGYSDVLIHDKLINKGFMPFAYDPFKRTLLEMDSFGKYNTIYLRDLSFVKDRLQAAKKVRILSETF